METKSNSKIYLWLAIAILAILLGIEKCNKSEESVAQNQVALEAKPAKVDTILIEVPSKPKIVYITKYKIIPNDKSKSIDTANKIVEVPVKVDSSLLLSKYYGRNYQIIETTLDPGYTSIVTIDAISRNKIIARRTYLRTFKKRPNYVSVYLVAPEKPKTREWYVGGGTSVSKYGFNTMHGSVLLKNKHDEIYQLSAGITNTSPLGVYEPFVGASILFKVK
jgi:hypothetical protein